MSGIINKAIKSCIRRGKRVKVARRYLSAKYNIKFGNQAFQNRVQYINQNL